MFTKDELAFVYQVMSGLPFGNLPGSPESLILAKTVGEKTRRMRDEISVKEATRPPDEQGDMVLEWRIPNEWTAVKSGKGKPKWMLGQLKNKLGDDLRKRIHGFPHADLCCARRRRWVQVRRFSDKKPDRPHCPDCLGARQAVDVLKDMGIVVDDSTVWTVDDADWIQCKRGQTHIVIRVFEIANEGRRWPEPECQPPPRPEKKRGRMTAAIIGGARG